MGLTIKVPAPLHCWRSQQCSSGCPRMDDPDAFDNSTEFQAAPAFKQLRPWYTPYAKLDLSTWASGAS